MCLPIGRRVQGVIHDRRSDVRGTSVLERFDDLDHKHMCLTWSLTASKTLLHREEWYPPAPARSKFNASKRGSGRRGSTRSTHTPV